MFGTNEKVGQKFFVGHPGELLVTSIFYTLQGEGPLAGQPSIFIRLAKCQLSCSFCDTWFDTGTWMTFAEIDKQINQALRAFFMPRIGDVPQWAKDKHFINLVITGGEPTLQIELLKYINQASRVYKNVQLESNGLIARELPDGVMLVVSPKCTESPRGEPIDYLKPPARVLERTTCLKFLLRNDSTSPYHFVPNWAFDWQYETGKIIYVSPMAEYLEKPAEQMARGALEERSKAERVSFWTTGLFDKGKMRRNYEYAAEYAMQTGCVLSLQQHLFSSIP